MIKKKKKQFLIVNLGTNLSQSYVNSMGNSSWVEFTQSTWLVSSNLFHFYLGLSLGCWCYEGVWNHSNGYGLKRVLLENTLKKNLFLKNIFYINISKRFENIKKNIFFEKPCFQYCLKECLGIRCKPHSQKFWIFFAFLLKMNFFICFQICANVKNNF
jgi:hypothetical protein